MRRLSILLAVVVIITSCSSPQKEGNVAISGYIKGLKKGTLYLQKIQDTLLVSVDSLVINGNPEFSFQATVTEPEVHYLYLDKSDGSQYNDRIEFFAEPGDIVINTSLNGFEKDVLIAGGPNQKRLQDFKKMDRRFNERNLRLIKEDYEAKKQNDQDKLDANDKEYKKLLKKKYLYTINFAIYNKEFEVAPYITLREVYDANIKYLDTVANSLSKDVKKSKYGEQLIEYIISRKEKDAAKAKLDTNE